MSESFTNTGKPPDGSEYYRNVVIGAYADYLDTGVWDLKGNDVLAPANLTMAQLRDFLLVSGGMVYLHKSGRLAWVIPGATNATAE